VNANQVAAEALGVAHQQVQARKLLGYPAAVLTLQELLAHAWLCGAIDVLTAQAKAPQP